MQNFVFDHRRPHWGPQHQLFPTSEEALICLSDQLHRTNLLSKTLFLPIIVFRTFHHAMQDFLL